MKKLIEIKQAMEEGMTLELEIDGGASEGIYHCTFDGFEQGKILVSPPARRGEKAAVRPGDWVRISFLLNNLFHLFESKVLSISPQGDLVIEDPQEISEAGLRQSARVDVDFSLTVLRENSTSFMGKALDTSLGGLSFTTTNPVEEGHITLSFMLPAAGSVPSTRVNADADIVGSRQIEIQGEKVWKVNVTYRGFSSESDRALLEYITARLEGDRTTKFHLWSSGQAEREVMALAAKENIATIWDRHEKMQPQCGFGELGICCRNCMQGPCRIDPFGEGAREGICGISGDGIVARNLLRMIAAGTAAHTEHARHLAHILMEGPADYPVKDRAKLKKVALSMHAKGIFATSPNEIGRMAMDGIAGHKDRVNPWLAGLPAKRKKILAELGVLPGAVDSMVTEIMHRTTMGVDANAENLLAAGMKCSLADYASMKISTDVSDILFGTPRPTISRAGLGVLKKDAVNVAVHGHNPMLAEAICDAAAAMNSDAVKAGAPGGINIVGMCCTGNEVLMRRGVPLAANYASQELAIATGALDAVIADYQCVMPSIRTVAECFQTMVITTMATAKLEPSKNVRHIPFEPEHARVSADAILRVALDAFARRRRVDIPKNGKTAMAGFSVESIVEALSALSPKDPLKPLIDNIVNGNIYGVALLCGCNNVNVTQDKNITTLAAELMKNNVLVLATGCAAGALAKAGYMDPETGPQYAGEKLRGVLAAIGTANNIASLPPALHMGSCVDNSRPIELAALLAQKLGADFSALPLVASAPEPMSEKAVAIGTAAVTIGLPVHLGVIPPIQGSERIVDILTKGLKNITGGWFIPEPNPVLAAEKLLDIIGEKRAALGIARVLKAAAGQ